MDGRDPDWTPKRHLARSFVHGLDAERTSEAPPGIDSDHTAAGSGICQFREAAASTEPADPRNPQTRAPALHPEDVFVQEPVPEGAVWVVALEEIHEPG